MKLKNQILDKSKSLGNEKPWVTGFLIYQVIRYLQEKFPHFSDELNYRELLDVVKGFENIQDPESFLKNPNHWLPQEVLQTLLRRCEEVSGDSDFAYHAAVFHFLSKEGRKPSAIEMVASLLGDIRLTFLCAPLWASVYTNHYLKLP